MDHLQDDGRELPVLPAGMGAMAADAAILMADGKLIPAICLEEGMKVVCPGMPAEVVDSVDFYVAEPGCLARLQPSEKSNVARGTDGHSRSSQFRHGVEVTSSDLVLVEKNQPSIDHRLLSLGWESASALRARVSYFVSPTPSSGNPAQAREVLW